MGVLIFTETGLKGSVPGDCKLVIDDDSGQAQRLVVYGFQSRYYDAGSSAALHYECESRQYLSGAGPDIGPAGASGGGANVVRHTGLLLTPQAILSTQTAGFGAHLSHVGDFRVFVRVQIPTSNAGIISVSLEWGEGDFRQTTLNKAVEIPATAKGKWLLLDLGMVHLSKVTQGTQRWEGRVNAWSTVIGDDIDLDRFFLAPTSEGYGEAKAFYAYRPSTVNARDEFTGMSASAPLNARAAPLGGTWATSGSATDFAAADAPGAGDETMARSTTADAGGGRFAVLGTTNYPDIVIGARVQRTDNPITVQQRVLARYVDANNYLEFGMQSLAALPIPMTVDVRKKVAGLSTTIAQLPLPGAMSFTGRWFGLRLVVFASGTGYAWLLDEGGNTLSTAVFTDVDLATGGALATGKPGLYDVNTGGACTRYYDDVYVATPPAEPLAIAPSRSLEIRSDQAIRQDAGGTLWQNVVLEGFYPRVPPAWLEGRTLRVLVATCRGPQLARGVWADPSIDDLSARMTYTPRVLNLPEA